MTETTLQNDLERRFSEIDATVEEARAGWDDLGLTPNGLDLWRSFAKLGAVQAIVFGIALQKFRDAEDSFKRHPTLDGAERLQAAAKEMLKLSAKAMGT